MTKIYETNTFYMNTEGATKILKNTEKKVRDLSVSQERFFKYIQKV